MLENDLQIDCVLAKAATPPVSIQCAGFANPSGKRLEKVGARVGEIGGRLDGFKVTGVFEGFELELVLVIAKRFL